MKNILLLILVLCSTILYSQKTHTVEYSAYNADTKEFNIQHVDTKPVLTFAYILSKSVVIVTDTGRTEYTFVEQLEDECKDSKCRKMWRVTDGTDTPAIYLQIITTRNTRDAAIQVMYSSIDLLITYYTVQPTKY